MITLSNRRAASRFFFCQEFDQGKGSTDSVECSLPHFNISNDQPSNILILVGETYVCYFVRNLRLNLLTVTVDDFLNHRTGLR